MKYITLTVPVYNHSDGSTSDEKIYIKPDAITEILPRSIAERRGDDDGWNSEIVMSNGNRYHVLEDPPRIHVLAEMISG